MPRESVISGNIMSSIGPLLPGRLPGPLLARRLQSSIQGTQAQLQNLQDQAATGQRFFRMSEDPSAAVRTLFYQKALERQEQFKINVATDRSLLALSEGALTTTSDALVRAKALLLEGTGDTASSAEKIALATEVNALITSVINSANTQSRGRFLFGGSESKQIPFERLGDGQVRYNGDDFSVDSFVDFNLQIANNVNGNEAYNATTQPITTDINPALSLETKIADLQKGDGITLGTIKVLVDDGVNPAQTIDVDLTGAETITDIKTRLEAAFAGGAPTLTVGINATNNGLLLTPSGGTVTVTDLANSRVAADLGIASAASATISGGDLNPNLSIQTKLTDLNGGAGASFTDGITITIGSTTTTVDLSTATTIQDVFNILKLENLDINVGLNSQSNGISITSKISGVGFSIGENGGNDATDLGIRTFGGSTLLADLNGGRGVPVDAGQQLEITRRDGTNISIDLAGKKTVQQVLDAINAVAPGQLIASLNSVGNGISIIDNDGVSTGPLTITENDVSVGLGIAGTESGSVATVPIVGKEVNSQEAEGVINLLIKLEAALRTGDDRELQRLDPLIDKETNRFALLRGEIGGRLKLLDDVEERLLDEEVTIREALSVEFDVDLTEVVTQVTYLQSSIQATLQIAASSLQLTLSNFL